MMKKNEPTNCRVGKTYPSQHFNFFRRMGGLCDIRKSPCSPLEIVGHPSEACTLCDRTF